MSDEERLKAAEALLERADEVIEILLGDQRHPQAEEVCAAIAEHFDMYDDDTGDEEHENPQSA